MSDTPRADAATSLIRSNHPLVCDTVSADFARDLERELAVAEGALRDLERISAIPPESGLIKAALRRLTEMRKEKK